MHLVKSMYLVYHVETVEYDSNKLSRCVDVSCVVHFMTK